MAANESLALLLVRLECARLPVFVFDLVQRVEPVPFVAKGAQQIRLAAQLALPVQSQPLLALKYDRSRCFIRRHLVRLQLTAGLVSCRLILYCQHQGRSSGAPSSPRALVLA